MPNRELAPSAVVGLENLVERGTIPADIAQEIGRLAGFAVSFESTQLPGLSDRVRAHIHTIDDLSRKEAETRGGLIYYHAGEVDPETLDAFSACFWESREAAAKALHGPSVHSCEAIPLAKSGLVYARYAIKFHAISPDSTTGFAVKPYQTITGHSYGPVGEEGSHATI